MISKANRRTGTLVVVHILEVNGRDCSSRTSDINGSVPAEEGSSSTIEYCISSGVDEKPDTVRSRWTTPVRIPGTFSFRTTNLLGSREYSMDVRWTLSRNAIGLRGTKFKMRLSELQRLGMSTPRNDSSIRTKQVNGGLTLDGCLCV